MVDIEDYFMLKDLAREQEQTIHITRDHSLRIIERMVRSGVLRSVKKSTRRVIYVLADRE